MLKSLGDGAPESNGPLALLPEPALREFCEKWGVAKLEVFGSVARGDANADSDVDLLVTFLEGRTPGMFGHARMIEEMKELLGRDVDILTRASVETSGNYLRREGILKDAQPIYPV